MVFFFVFSQIPSVSQTQCAATERAGQLAGLDKVKLMREPEAAALAYGLDKVRGLLHIVSKLSMYRNVGFSTLNFRFIAISNVRHQNFDLSLIHI